MTQRTVEVDTADGTCPASLSIPEEGGRWPAVIMYPDAGGIRDVLREMGERLSALGYVVLVPDFYYRNGPYDLGDLKTAFSREESREKIMQMMQGYTTDLAVSDAAAYVDYLNALPEKAPGGVGTTGYCMGGRLSLTVAANLGPTVAASASFHGGGIAKAGDPNSPHHRADSIRATVYVAGAIGINHSPTSDKEILEKSLTEAGVTHTIETYQARHGFAVPTTRPTTRPPPNATGTPWRIFSARPSAPDDP